MSKNFKIAIFLKWRGLWRIKKTAKKYKNCAHKKLLYYSPKHFIAIGLNLLLFFLSNRWLCFIWIFLFGTIFVPPHLAFLVCAHLLLLSNDSLPNWKSWEHEFNTSVTIHSRPVSRCFPPFSIKITFSSWAFLLVRRNFFFIDSFHLFLLFISSAEMGMVFVPFFLWVSIFHSDLGPKCFIVLQELDWSHRKRLQQTFLYWRLGDKVANGKYTNREAKNRRPTTKELCFQFHTKIKWTNKSNAHKQICIFSR